MRHMQPFCDLTLNTARKVLLTRINFIKLRSLKATFWTLGQLVFAMTCLWSEHPVRASVMFGVFLGIGAMIFALVRAYSPRFIFFSIFGTITLDIFCVRGYLLLSWCARHRSSVSLSARSTRSRTTRSSTVSSSQRLVIVPSHSSVVLYSSLRP